jgi:hypothetical protein
MGGLVEAEGLERSGEGEEEQCRCNEYTEIQMGVPNVMEEGSLRRHLSFLPDRTIYDKLSPNYECRVTSRAWESDFASKKRGMGRNFMLFIASDRLTVSDSR